MNAKNLIMMFVAATMLFTGLQQDTVLAETSATQRAEFRREVRERDRISVSIQKMERKLEEMVKAGKQTSDEYTLGLLELRNLKDELDIKEQKLSHLSFRYGLDIPKAPSINAPKAIAAPVAQVPSSQSGLAQRMFADEIAGTHGRLATDCKSFLRSIDFSAFLAD